MAKRSIWYKIHVRWPSCSKTSTVVGDVFFHTKACSIEDARIIGAEMVEDLIPSLCQLPYTLWATEALKYLPKPAL